MEPKKEVQHSAARRAAQRQQEAKDNVDNKFLPVGQEPSLTDMTVQKDQRSFKNTTPEGFNERAAKNLENVSSVHEFRRQNIQDYEPTEDNLFNYQSDENEVKYQALKVEDMFRHQNTLKAIRWGIFVGGLFGAHRYYRSRDIQGSLTWFCGISGLSFFNIFMSYGLQEFVTQSATTSGISQSSRQEYHMEAYKHYIEKQQNSITMLDNTGDAEPILMNSQSESMNKFVKDIEDKLKFHHKSYGLKKSEVFDIKLGNTFVDQLQKKKITSKHIRFSQQDTDITSLNKLMKQGKYDELKSDYDQLMAQQYDLIDGDGTEFEKKIMYRFDREHV